MLPERFTGIDDTNRGQHHYLEEGDRVWYGGEYYARKGYEAGPTNQLIINLKIKPSVVASKPGRGYWKERAIAQVAGQLPRILSKADIEQHTWVPVPPSKCVGHPDHDPRLERILTAAFPAHNAEVRLLIRQTQSTVADHEAVGSRLSPEELRAVMEIDKGALARGGIRPRGIVLFDDVLVTGKHFKCGQRLLRAELGDVPIKGVFIARRVLDLDIAAEFEVITDDDV